MTAQEAVAFLASKRRTVLLGGMAVILHGLSRNTKDYDIWLDPLPDAQAWAAAIQQLLAREPSLQAQRISAFGGWTPISVANVPAVGTEDRLIRIAGAERPGFGQKALSRCCIAFGREKEVDRRTSEMRRRKKATKIDV
jgi:hypothetical protein